MTTTASIKKFGHTFSVSLDDDGGIGGGGIGGELKIYRDGGFEGTAIWCACCGIRASKAPLLGLPPEHKTEVYEALDEALEEALEEA